MAEEKDINPYQEVGDTSVSEGIPYVVARVLTNKVITNPELQGVLGLTTDEARAYEMKRTPEFYQAIKEAYEAGLNGKRNPWADPDSADFVPWYEDDAK